MAHRADEIALTLEQRRHLQMDLEVSRLAPDKIVVEHQRAQRIGLGEPPRLFKAGAQARRPEAILDLAGRPFARGPEQQLPALRLEYEIAVAHQDLPILASQIERGEGPARTEITGNAVEAQPK